MSETHGKRTGRPLARPLALGLALASVLFAATAPAQAQRPRQDPPRREQMDPEERLERRVEMLTERLGLTEAQAAEVHALFRQEAERMRAAFAEAGIEPRQGAAPRPRARRGEGERVDADTRKELRAAMEAIREDTEEGLARILTAPQLEQYRALREQARERMDRRGPRARFRSGR